MTLKSGLYISTVQRAFSTVCNLLSSSFRIHTNNTTVSSETFRQDVIVMNEKLLYYINEYFQINDNRNGKEKEKRKEKNEKNEKNEFYKKRIGGLFPPCYSQVVFKFCIFMNNFDYISIPIPIKNSKQIKQKYSFFISENKTDLILCHPFYKHYIEEISFHLQIPFLICYDKPDILTVEQYLEDWAEGKEEIASKLLYQPSYYPKQIQIHHKFKLHEDSDNRNKTEVTNNNIFNNNIFNNNIFNNNIFNNNISNNNISNNNISNNNISNNNNNNISKQWGENWKEKWEEWMLKKKKTKRNDPGVGNGIEIDKHEMCEEESSIFLQLSRENECDRSIQFLISKIWEQSQNLNKICTFKESDTALLCMPPNKIEYYDVLFSLINSASTIIFPEVNKRKVLYDSNYMSWFKIHMQKKKENHFPVHRIIKQNDSFDKTSDFVIIDGASLFDEINKCERNITILILNNYLIRDFLFFWEHCDINKLTKNEFLENKASKINTILINGNEIKPGVHKQHVEKIRDIFKNAKIYQRYVLQEIGTICVTPLTYVEESEILEHQRNIAGYLLPNVIAEIDPITNVLRVKMNYNNDVDSNSVHNYNNMNYSNDNDFKKSTFNNNINNINNNDDDNNNDNCNNINMNNTTNTIDTTITANNNNNNNINNNNININENNKTRNIFNEKGFFQTKYVASINNNFLLTINGYFNEIENIPKEYHLYYKQQRDKMEKMPPGYLKRVRLHGQIWGNFHANKKNWKRKF